MLICGALLLFKALLIGQDEFFGCLKHQGDITSTSLWCWFAGTAVVQGSLKGTGWSSLVFWNIRLTSLQHHLYVVLQALLVFKALSMAQDEVHWVLRHVANPPSRRHNVKLPQEDFHDRQLPELLFYMEELRGEWLGTAVFFIIMNGNILTNGRQTMRRINKRFWHLVSLSGKRRKTTTKRRKKQRRGQMRYSLIQFGCHILVCPLLCFFLLFVVVCLSSFTWWRH